jgi:hypothetical protein
MEFITLLPINHTGQENYASGRKGMAMLDPDVIVKSVVESVTEVFEMMLGMEARFDGILTEGQKSESGLIALVGITGEWGGSGIFCCGPEFANEICTVMLGAPRKRGRRRSITKSWM